jgi:hypothetical protein
MRPLIGSSSSRFFFEKGAVVFAGDEPGMLALQNPRDANEPSPAMLDRSKIHIYGMVGLEIHRVVDSLIETHLLQSQTGSHVTNGNL